MCIDFLACCCLSLGKRKKHVAQHPFPLVKLTCSNFFFCSVALCIFILHPLKWCQSQPVSICVFVCCVTVCASVSLLGPCCWRTRQAVPNKRAQGGLLWQQLLWCAVLSVFVCLCVCVCAVSWPCRADRPSSHGAGSSCVLCCRSGSLSHRTVVSTVSCHKQPQ